MQKLFVLVGSLLSAGLVVLVSACSLDAPSRSHKDGAVGAVGTGGAVGWRSSGGSAGSRFDVDGNRRPSKYDHQAAGREP
jgi:hypothetical protein